MALQFDNTVQSLDDKLTHFKVGNYPVQTCKTNTMDGQGWAAMEMKDFQVYFDAGVVDVEKESML